MEKINTTGLCVDLSDEKLFSLCKKFGAQALEARRKFLGLLPEVNRREAASRSLGRSWLGRRGFSSIFEFAKKLAGASEDQVRIVLNLERRFDDKPVLQAMLISGEVSVNKLARVVSIATAENQAVLAEQVKTLPKAALETLVKDIKHSQPEGLFEPCSSLPGQTFGDKKPHASGELLSMKIELNLDDDIVADLHELQEKGININVILREVLKKRRDVIAQAKAELAEESGSAAPSSGSRYISVRVKKVITEEHGTKCSIPNCRQNAELIHHTRRFALTQSHDPHYLAPLCKEHHLIAHSVDGKFWGRRR